MKSIFKILILFISYSSVAQDAKFVNLAVADFKTQILKSDSKIILDVRTPEETKKGMIEGAKNINFYEPTFEVELNKLDKNKPVYVYCAAGGRSGKTAKILTQKGFKKVYNLEGGYTAWQQGVK